MIPTIEIYSSLECPYAYLLNFRLRQVWPEFAGRLAIIWRALSLEYINQVGNSRSTFDAERELFGRIDPYLPLKSWRRPTWDWPVTLWPAFEALSCAQAQNSQAAFEMSWALRYAFFADGRNIALRHELLLVAAQVARSTQLDIDRFTEDWDSGRYKHSVLQESMIGWHSLKVRGSATLVLPDGSQFTNPAIGVGDHGTDTSADQSSPNTADSLEELRLLLRQAIG